MECYLQAQYSYSDCDSQSLWTNRRWYTCKDDTVTDEIFAMKYLLDTLPVVKREDDSIKEQDGIVNVEYRIIKIDVLWGERK